MGLALQVCLNISVLQSAVADQAFHQVRVFQAVRGFQRDNRSIHRTTNTDRTSLDERLGSPDLKFSRRITRSESDSPKLRLKKANLGHVGGDRGDFIGEETEKHATNDEGSCGETDRQIGSNARLQEGHVLEKRIGKGLS